MPTDLTHWSRARSSEWGRAWRAWWLVTSVLVLLCVPRSAQAQSQTGPQPQAMLVAVQKGFSEGDARQVTMHAAGRLEMSIMGSSRLYSKAQAQYVMAAFFKDYPPALVDFQAPHKGMRGWVVSARYETAEADEPLHLFLQLQQRSGRWLLREIRIMIGS